jgi:hypothetical protein
MDWLISAARNSLTSRPLHAVTSAVRADARWLARAAHGGAFAT